MSGKDGKMGWTDKPAVALRSLEEVINQKHMLLCALGHGTI